MNAEEQRLLEVREQRIPRKKWGPYLSERQWGTVREDYSELGNAWDYFSHDQARSRAYRWAGRYFDVFVEYAKAAPEDMLIQISVVNRGPEAAALHVPPTLWFRNTWSWYADALKPTLRQVSGERLSAIAAFHPLLGDYYLSAVVPHVQR